ncbi:hypothetical protein E4U41_003003 [Claviceps citrina]|nr:hypothetical protein E4U41_003003 [Claviceps citrina]
MAPPRRNRPPSARAQLPPIAALFLIEFHVRAGYTITWKRAVPHVELDGRGVEYKSLPSGLHTVRDDLVYFVDGAHAGLSAFVNEPCDEDEARNARMMAVGVLVPLSCGRLGRAWRHVETLKELAAQLAKDRNRTHLLDRYWDENRAGREEDQTTQETAKIPPDTPTRGPSEPTLSPFHPAWSLVDLLDTFGPLIYPVQRAALLRKRILISCHAPVHQVCDFVYGISILSNIPLSVAERLPAPSPTARLRPLFNIGVHDIPFLMDDSAAHKRRQDGQTVPAGGEEEAGDEAGCGWVACTTDSVLATKDTLWDMLITMPPKHASSSHPHPHPNGGAHRGRAWPTVEYPRGTSVKATQRDLRRFNALRTGLVRLAATPPDQEQPGPPRPSEAATPVRPSTGHSHRLVKDAAEEETVDALIEPVTWTALAYNGYMWWASAGQQLRSEEQEESSRDAALLADLAPAPHTHTPMASPSQPPGDLVLLSDSLSSLAPRPSAATPEARTELAIIAYFHRLTTQMLSVLTDLVDNNNNNTTTTDEAVLPRTPYRDDSDSDSESDPDPDPDPDPAPDSDQDQQHPEHTPPQDEEADHLPLLPLPPPHNDPPPGREPTTALTVDTHSLETMGLDVWSPADSAFVEDLMGLYFGRRAVVERGKGVEICGLRVC